MGASQAINVKNKPIKDVMRELGCPKVSMSD